MTMSRGLSVCPLVARRNARRASFFALLAIASACGISGCGSHLPAASERRESPAAAAPLSPATVAQIKTFCGDCHTLPDPQTFPKSRWDAEVEQGYNFYIASGRTDLVEPKRSDSVRFFRDPAPEAIAIPSPPSEPTAHTFRKIEPVAVRNKEANCIAHVIWDSAAEQLLSSDMRTGRVTAYRPSDDWKAEVLGQVTNSCRVTPCDWNDDGRKDYLVADIGSFPVGDHHNGRLQLWLAEAGGGFRTLDLATGLARLVEAQPLDYDGDGDTDVLLAEFGWRVTGAMKLLRNPGGSDAEKAMTVEVLDPRHGVLGVQVADLNGDGRQDYLVAYGQEFETLEAYYNRGPGQYERSVIHQLADPSYNASSFALADIDADGRIDIVQTNGDTMDAFLPKPYHGVRWLRNLGDEKWETHELGLLVGALQACVADFDGDGDLDIAAAGMLPPAPESSGQPIDSIVWWEQDADLVFKRHALEQYGTSHAACTAGDVNGDGLPDLIVGQWALTAAVPPVVVYLSTLPEKR